MGGDPRARLRTHLVAQGALSDDDEQRIAAGAERIAADMRTALNTDDELDPEDLFRFVTAERSPQLEEQWRMLQGEIERDALAESGGRP